MIVHFLEVWALFLLVFVVGCGLGAIVHAGLAAGPLAGAQDTFAYGVGRAIDLIKWRLGIAPDWRPEFHTERRWSGEPEHEYGIDGGVETESETDQHQWDGEEPAAFDEWYGDDDPRENDLAGAGEWDEQEFLEAEALAGDGERRDDRPDVESNDMMRPAGLAEPRAGVPDNLQRIWGIGSRNEALLHSFGIFHFGQIAAWTPAEARWVAARLAFPERLERDNWIGQAIVLATGGDPSSVSPSNKIEEGPSDEDDA